MQQPAFPPCPECGGPRAFFDYAVGGNRATIVLGLLHVVSIYACTCLSCGHTTLRPHPNDLEKLRRAAG